MKNCKTSDPSLDDNYSGVSDSASFPISAHRASSSHLPHVSLEMSVAADVSDWIAAPAPLNRNKCGRRAVFSSDNSVVQRRDPEILGGDCVCYTVHPLPPGQVWHTTVLETTTKWGAGLVSGCVQSLLYTKTSKHSSTMTATVCNIIIIVLCMQDPHLI